MDLGDRFGRKVSSRKIYHLLLGKVVGPVTSLYRSFVQHMALKHRTTEFQGSMGAWVTRDSAATTVTRDGGQLEMETCIRPWIPV